MDIPTILQEVEAWPMEERIQLVEALWNQVAEENVQQELSESQKRELDRRLESLNADPQDVFSWEEVQRYVRRTR